MSIIKLNFINNSNDTNNSQIVIFQKNVATNFGELAVAWKVIQNCGTGDNHPFTYPTDFMVGASDSYGNYTPMQNSANGQAFDMVKTPSGHSLQLSVAPSSHPENVEVRNNLLGNGSINANIYKDGKLLAVSQGISPGSKTSFQFKPTIWIGVVSQIEEGAVMNSAIMQDINTELSLLGITKANIIMTGGGPGKSATPFKFTLMPL